MTWDCLIERTDCWPVDPPAASVVVLATVVFIVCVACVVGATLPGRATVRLGQREGAVDRGAAVVSVLYVGWAMANLAIAVWAWGQLFPRTVPVRLVHNARMVAPAACESGRVRDVRCALGALPSDIPLAAGLDRVARELIDRVQDPPRGPVPPAAAPLTADVAAYAALMTTPVSELVIAGTMGTDPATVRDLATQGWPWVARWIARYEGRGRRVVPEVVSVGTAAEQATCLRAPRDATHAPDVVLIRFCLLPPASGAIEAVIGVRRDGGHVLVEVQGRALPAQGFAAIDGVPLSGTLTPVPASDRAVLRLAGAAALLDTGRELRVGTSPNALSVGRALGFGEARPWCLVAEDPPRAIAPVRNQVRNAFAPPRRPALEALVIANAPCSHGTLYIAKNGTVIAGADLTMASAQAMADALAPAALSAAFRPRVLDPIFDTAPGLLDDVRLGQSALTHGMLVVSPLVVREVGYTGPRAGASDPGRGYADFVEDRLVDPAVPLAAIVAWVEGGPITRGSGRILAGSFAQDLWSSDAITQAGAWGALLAMREAFDAGAAAPVSSSSLSADALGVAVNRVVDEDRQRRLFAALGGWLLLMFLMRWGAR